MHLSTEEIVDLTNLNPPQTDEDKEANDTIKEGKISKSSTKDTAKSSKKGSTKTKKMNGYYPIIIVQVIIEYWWTGWLINPTIPQDLVWWIPLKRLLDRVWVKPLLKLGEEEQLFSERFERDGMEFVEPTPQMFSFNNPFGACSQCEGFGRVAGIDENLVIPDHEKSIRNNTIAPFDSPKFSQHLRDLIQVAARERWPIDVPYRELPKEVKRALWKGKDEYIGIYAFFDQVRSQNYKVHMRVLYARYRGYSRCSECEGYRIRKDAQYVRIGEMHLGEVSGINHWSCQTMF